MTYIELISLDALQVNSDRVLAWVLIINVAGPVRGQVSMTILEGWNLVFPVRSLAVSRVARKSIVQGR